MIKEKINDFESISLQSNFESIPTVHFIPCLFLTLFGINILSSVDSSQATSHHVEYCILNRTNCKSFVWNIWIWPKRVSYGRCTFINYTSLCVLTWLGYYRVPLFTRKYTTQFPHLKILLPKGLFFLSCTFSTLSYSLTHPFFMFPLIFFH